MSLLFTEQAGVETQSKGSSKILDEENSTLVKMLTLKPKPERKSSAAFRRSTLVPTINTYKKTVKDESKMVN